MYVQCVRMSLNCQVGKGSQSVEYRKFDEGNPSPLAATMKICEGFSACLRYPPICDMPRPMLKSPSAMPWPHGLRQIAERIRPVN
jgi:hypothetical protein